MAILQGSYTGIHKEMAKILYESTPRDKSTFQKLIEEARHKIVDQAFDRTFVYPIYGMPDPKAPELPRQSEPDRIWDQAELAAESSRYGK